MSDLLDFAEPAVNLVPGAPSGTFPDPEVRVALPTVNPGDDDDEDEETGNIDPDEDEGLDDDEEDDEDDPLWARLAPRRGRKSGGRLLRRNNTPIRRLTRRRHTAQPGCPIAL